MKIKRRAEMRKWKIILVFAIALLAGLITYIFPAFTNPLEQPVLDHHLRNTAPGYEHQRIVVVMIRDSSVVQIGNWPWPTDIYAEMLNGPLADAKTIAFDVDFGSLGNAEGDAKFARAMRQQGNVVLGARYLPVQNKFIYPRKELRDGAARIGIYQTLPESDGVYRKFQIYAQNEVGTLHPTYMHAILLQSGYKLQFDESTYTLNVYGSDHAHFSQIQLDENYAAWTTTTDAGDMEVYEYIDVLEGRVPASVFDDAIVFVGASNASERRLISTPDGDVYASVGTANQLLTALSGFSPGEVSSWQQALLVAAACLLCGFAALLLTPVFSFVVPAALTIALSLISHYLFLNGTLYLPIASILLWGWVLFLMVVFIQIRSVASIANYTSIPLQQTFSSNIGSDAEGKERIVRHLQGLGGIFQSAGLQLIDPLVGDDDAFVQQHKEQLPAGSADGASVVIKNVSKQKPKHRVLVSHPKTDPAEPNEYTLLGMNRAGSDYVVPSMASLIRNASLYYKALQYGEEKQTMSFNMIKCMVAAMDAKDPITAGHSQRVAQVALQIAKKMGFTGRELEELELAAIVHDIGKIGIQDNVLHKRGIFSSNEFTEMKTHPNKGISIMSPSGLTPNTIDAILNHHERLDGQGYPDGKTQDEIGVYAKIIKVSDVYDALMGERQYKKAWPPEKVCDILYLGRGTEFDTEITDLFLDMVKPTGWTPPEGAKSKKSLPAETYEKYRQYGIKQVHLLKGYLRNIKKEGSAYYSGLVNMEDRNIFFGMEWGEPFWAGHFLSRRPYLVEYDTASEACHFALRLDGELHGVVVYSFLRDFLTSGTLFITSGSFEPETFFGSPANTDEEHPVWDLGKLFILQEKDVEGFESVVTFITKYAFSDNAAH